MPTGYVTVSASNLQFGGVKIANATISFTPVGNQGVPISVLIDSNGGITTGPFQTTVTNGAFTIVLPNPSLTQPIDAGYSITLQDNNTGKAIPLYGFGCFQPTFTLATNYGYTGTYTAWVTAGSPVNFDAIPPNLASILTVQQGPMGPPGIAVLGNTVISILGDTATGLMYTLAVISGALTLMPFVGVVLLDTVNGSFYAIQATSGSMVIAPVGGNPTLTAVPTLDDTATGAKFTLTMVSGSFELLPVASGTTSVASLSLTDTVTMTTHTLTVVNGSLSLS